MARLNLKSAAMAIVGSLLWPPTLSVTINQMKFKTRTCAVKISMAAMRPATDKIGRTKISKIRKYPFKADSPGSPSPSILKCAKAHSGTPTIASKMVLIHEATAK